MVLIGCFRLWRLCACFGHFFSSGCCCCRRTLPHSTPPCNPPLYAPPPCSTLLQQWTWTPTAPPQPLLPLLRTRARRVPPVPRRYQQQVSACINTASNSFHAATCVLICPCGVCIAVCSWCPGAAWRRASEGHRRAAAVRALFTPTQPCQAPSPPWTRQGMQKAFSVSGWSACSCPRCPGDSCFFFCCARTPPSAQAPRCIRSRSADRAHARPPTRARNQTTSNG